MRIQFTFPSTLFVSNVFIYHLIRITNRPSFNYRLSIIRHLRLPFLINVSIRSGDGVDTRIHFFLPDNPFLPRPRVHPSPTRELWILEKEDPFPINTQHRLRCRQGPSPSLLPLDHRLLTASKGERESRYLLLARRIEGWGPIRI